MLLIGVTGPKRSGKNTVGEFIKEWGYENNVQVTVRGFADALKYSAYRLFKPDCTMDEAIVWADEFKEQGRISMGDIGPVVSMSGREFLQRYGTEAHRDVFGKDFWIDQLIPVDHPELHFDYAGIGVITDVRFDDEAARIQQVNGAVWSIEGRGEWSGEHASEGGIHPSYVDTIIVNSDSLDCLRNTVNVAMAKARDDSQMKLEI